ncbi:hypothetical protein RhiXN_07427 [Rhizoctonia solani]|uniref:Uncharacterized protein n=1 Tax=Rhizoctonia solani TaxID=456999 RepID=A0A8H8P7Z1_9AGAM|nr:uncharacterized protein RhiXN_07427 [Rhizoctonia solani]QRW25478.1 hypothetical protein RhiXN_07427 [Rhizoctonia solani]
MSQSDQHLRVPPTYAASLNSDFSTSDALSSTVPQYSRSASPDERVLAGHVMRTFGAFNAQDLPSRFEYSTNHLTLNLGERNWHCPLPCYGYSGTIEGTVRVHQIDTVSKVEVSLIGEVSTTISETAVPSQGASKRFLKQRITIWNSDSAMGNHSTLPFSINFPGGSASSDLELPPSFRLGTGELSARVQYRIQVDLFRKGLRRHKRFETEVIYLPKSFAPALQARSIHIDTKSDDPDGWTRQVLLPTHLPGRPNAARTEIPSEMVVELHIPSQTVLTANSVLPYTIRIHSASSTTSRASSVSVSLALVEAQLQLVRSTVVIVHGIKKRKDVVLANGTVTSDFQGTDADEGYPTSSLSTLEGVRVINGTLEVASRTGAELSWELQDFIEVKYYLIAIAKPPVNLRALEGAFPTFRVIIDVEMKTHVKLDEHSENDIDTDPSVGLFSYS